MIWLLFCLVFFWADALSADGQNEFFSEAKLMKEIGTHANIVGLIFDGYLEGRRAGVYYDHSFIELLSSVKQEESGWPQLCITIILF